MREEEENGALNVSDSRENVALSDQIMFFKEVQGPTPYLRPGHQPFKRPGGNYDLTIYVVGRSFARLPPVNSDHVHHAAESVRQS